MKSKTMYKTSAVLKSYSVIVLGTLLAAMSINLFLAPLQIVAGGASGAAIIMNKLFALPIGGTMLMINIPLFILGMKSMGNGFLLRSIFGTILYSIFTDATAPILPTITAQPILGALAGGALLGFGLGMVFLTGASTGGTDILAKLGHRMIRAVDVGQWIFIIDFIIIAASGMVFENYEACLYGFIALYISSHVIDFMIQGANSAKMVYIISPEYKKIADAVMHGMSRGVTGIRAHGMYADEEKMMLMCIIKNFEIQKLEKITETCDKNAFLIFSQVRQVTGEGFRVYPE